MKKRVGGRIGSFSHTECKLEREVLYLRANSLFCTQDGILQYTCLDGSVLKQLISGFMGLQ